MNQLRAWAGTPSLAELNKRSGGYLLPPSTLSDVLRRQRLPRLDLVLAYARACGLNDEQVTAWEQAWAAVRESDLGPASQAPPAEVPPERPSWAARALARREAAGAASRNFLVWMSGARPELLRLSRTDRLAYTGLGAAILITGAIAALSAAFALHTALYLAWPPAVLLGGAWGAAVMSIDRWLVFTIRRGQRQKLLLIVLPRLTLSVLFALIFATPVLMRMFAPEISAQILTIDHARAEQASAALTHGSIGTEIVSLQARLAQEQQAANADFRLWSCQLYGGSRCLNSQPGNGPLALAAERQYLAASSEVRNLTAQLSQARAELTALQRQTSNLIIHGKPGLLARLDALDQVASHSSVLAAARLLVFLLFMVMGCLPVIVRTMHVLGPQGTYETLLKMQESADIQIASLHIRNQAQADPPQPGKVTSLAAKRRRLPPSST
jgi:hypothetical protein